MILLLNKITTVACVLGILRELGIKYNVNQACKNSFMLCVFSVVRTI